MIARLLTAVALVLGSTTPAPASAAAGGVWLGRYEELAARIGDSLLQDGDSATLAWGESYVMRSHLDIYRKTGDATWLDTFVRHADAVIGHADDIDGDGYLGWSTSRYSPVESLNPGFETAASGDATLPAGWTRFQDSGSHVHRTTDVPSGTGSRSVRVVSDLTRWKKLHQPVNARYAGGTTHVLRGWGKRTGSVAGRIVVRDGSTTLCGLEYTTSTWTYKETACVLPAGRSPEVWLEHDTYKVSGSAYFDDVKLSGRFPYIVHDAMIGIPIAEFVRLVAQDAALSRYGVKAAAYRAFLENHIVPRWESSAYLGDTWRPLGATEGVYLQSPKLDTLSHTRPSDELPYNMALAFANLLLVLHSVNGDAAYLDRATRVARWARNDLTTSGGAFTWNYATYTTTREDVSHANVDLSAFLEFQRQGYVFTASDMAAFKNTFKTRMWNGSTTAPVFSLRVDGTGNADGADSYLHSWLELTDWDPQVKELVAAKYTGFTATNAGHLITLARLAARE
ncbi:hypothetical protein [Nonomuraea sp. NPDC005501]|uniref:hypothetical protein n=1 Tax=Nonomuraea sp. NPDC005501 TaxID=3156884 RepID=UPI0033A98981